MRVFYRPADAWVGDAIPFWDGRFQVYFLADKRAGGTYGERTSWDLVETDDRLRFHERGTAIPHGTDDAPDRNAYTGSVIKGRDGRHHIFYTGHNPAIQRDGVPVQVVLHATSADGVRWEKDEGFALHSDGRVYEVHDWRDPFVFWSDEEGRYLMLVTSRLQGGSAREAGCIATLYSDDLLSWEHGEPFFSTSQYITLECPDYFRIGEWHYLVYSTFSERFVTHYRKSRSFRGPYLSARTDTFDGRGCYAIKTAGHGVERSAFGWVPSKAGGTDYGDWEWAGTLVAHDLWQDEHGDLLVRIPPAIEAAFSEPAPADLAAGSGHGFTVAAGSVRLDSVDGQAKCVLAPLPEQALVEAEFRGWSARRFGLAFRCDDTFDQGYFISFEPGFNRITLDIWPRRVPGEFQWQIAGDRPQVIELERPLQFAGLEAIRVKLIVEDDIFLLNVNDAVAMTGRCYNFRSGKLALFAQEGAVTASAVNVRTMPGTGDKGGEEDDG